MIYTFELIISIHISKFITKKVLKKLIFSGSKWGCHWRMWIQCMECCTAHLFVEFSILNKSCATHHMQDISSVIGNT